MDLSAIMNQILEYRIILIILFILFLLLARFVFKTIIQLTIIVILSAIFPVFAVKVLGFQMPLNPDTFLFFITFGAGLYFIYYFLKYLWIFSKILCYVAEAATRSLKHFYNVRKKTSEDKKVKKESKRDSKQA